MICNEAVCRFIFTCNDFPECLFRIAEVPLTTQSPCAVSLFALRNRQGLAHPLYFFARLIKHVLNLAISARLALTLSYNRQVPAVRLPLLTKLVNAAPARVILGSSFRNRVEINQRYPSIPFYFGTANFSL